MNLIEAWKQVPSGAEIALVGEHGEEEITVVKRGTFANTVRRLMDVTHEEDILSDRWRWRV
jgi:hypothetical protein